MSKSNDGHDDNHNDDDGQRDEDRPAEIVQSHGFAVAFGLPGDASPEHDYTGIEVIFEYTRNTGIQ